MGTAADKARKDTHELSAGAVDQIVDGGLTMPENPSTLAKVSQEKTINVS